MTVPDVIPPITREAKLSPEQLNRAEQALAEIQSEVDAVCADFLSRLDTQDELSSLYVTGKRRASSTLAAGSLPADFAVDADSMFGSYRKRESIDSKSKDEDEWQDHDMDDGQSSGGSSNGTASSRRRQSSRRKSSGHAHSAGTFDAADGSCKKRRSKLPLKAVLTLRDWFTNHVNHPYPTEAEKQDLASATGLSVKQCTNWFTNTRKRFWQPYLKKAKSAQIQINEADFVCHLQNVIGQDYNGAPLGGGHPSRQAQQAHSQPGAATVAAAAAVALLPAQVAAMQQLRSVAAASAAASAASTAASATAGFSARALGALI